MFYGRFLSSSKASIAPIPIIATMIPTDNGTKNWSAMDVVVVGVGIAVGCVSIMLNTVSECDGQ